jgi:2-isopropylmalate synthase
MNVPEKHELFQTLCRIGFKEIEIGFPSASDTEFAFTRELIEKQLIPEDVSVQVLVQAREHLIRRTIESLKGARRAIVHLYTPTNPAQREIVFNLSKAQVLEMAVNGTKLIRELHRRPAGDALAAGVQPGDVRAAPSPTTPSRSAKRSPRPGARPRSARSS